MEFMLKDVRLSFPDLAEPKAYQDKPGGAKRWGATLLVPQGSDQAKAIDAAIVSVLTEKLAGKFKKPEQLKAKIAEIMADKKATCWANGDAKPYDGYEGMMALTAYRYEDKGRPIVMDNDKSPLYAADNSLMPGKGGRLYGGCYVNAKVEIWAQDNTHGQGVRATLMVIQRNRKGDAFGGGAAPSDDGFDEVADGSDADDMA